MVNPLPDLLHRKRRVLQGIVATNGVCLQGLLENLGIADSWLIVLPALRVGVARVGKNH